MNRTVLALLLCGCATTAKQPVVTSPPPPPPAPAPVAPPWTQPEVPAALPAVPRSRPSADTRTLKNGLRLVVVEDHRARLVKARLFFANGSAADSDESAGATAFALELAGDRFDRRDEDGLRVDPQEQSAHFQALIDGAALVHGVTPDVAWMGVDGYSRDTTRLLARLSNVITDRRHGEDSFRARSAGAIELINELELTDGVVLDQYLTQLAFGAEHAYARAPYGTADSLEHLSLEQVSRRQLELFTPRGSTLLVVGDVKAGAVAAQVERFFGSWRGGSPAAVRVEPPRPVKRRNVVFLPRKPSRNTLVCLTRPLTDVLGAKPAKRSAVVELVVAVLGRDRIPRELREKLGLTYDVQASMLEQRAATALSVCSRVRSSEAISASRLMLEAFASLEQVPPTDEELARARATLITERETAQDDLGGIIAAWEHAAVMGREAPPEDDVEQLRSVTRAQVESVAKALSGRDTLQVIISGEQRMAEATARANALGALKVPRLRRIELEEE